MSDRRLLGNLEEAESLYIRTKRNRQRVQVALENAYLAETTAALIVERLRTRLGVKPLTTELLAEGNARATALEHLPEDLPGLGDAGEQGGQGGGEDKGEAETLAHSGSPSG